MVRTSKCNASTPTTFLADILRGPKIGRAVLNTEVLDVQEPWCLSIRQVHICSSELYTTLSTADMLEMHVRSPRVASLQLIDVSPSMEAVPRSSSAFQNLASLTVRPSTVSLYDFGMLFSLFQLMPRLRALELAMPRTGPFAKLGGGYLPTPPFSLESFIYAGFIPVSAFALIVRCSSRTLRTLHIQDVWDYDASGPDGENALFDALRAAAPHLRDFRITLPATGTIGFVENLQPVFASFSRMTVLGISASQYLTWSARLLVDAAPPGIVIRHLHLERLNARSYDAVDIPLDHLRSAPQLRKLRSLGLAGFSSHGKSTLALLEHCRMRRIRWIDFQ